MSASSRAELLAELRRRVRRIEGIGGEGGRVLPLGRDLDSVLPEAGLPLGCLHEVIGWNPAGDALPGGAATGFATVLAGLIAARHGLAVWLTRKRDLYAPGLAAYGLGPERLIVVRAVSESDLLWATEEILRCRGIGVTVAEIESVGLTPSRRLQLAAEAGGVTGILLRSGIERLESSAAVTRWAVTAAPSRAEVDEPGIGVPCWHVRLLRCRGGQPGEWLAEWRGGRLVISRVGAEGAPGHAASQKAGPVRDDLDFRYGIG